MPCPFTGKKPRQHHECLQIRMGVREAVPVIFFDKPNSESECKTEIRVFLRGAEGGVKRLKEILPSLFAYYKIVTIDGKARLLSECGLIPYRCQDAGGDVTFFFDGSEVRDQFKPPRSVSEAWIKPGEKLETPVPEPQPAPPPAPAPEPAPEPQPSPAPAAAPEHNSPKEEEVAPATPESVHDSQPPTPVAGHATTTSSPMCCE